MTAAAEPWARMVSVEVLVAWRPRPLNHSDTWAAAPGLGGKSRPNVPGLSHSW